ncbi:MAG TPA: LLM class F420-dependent oxidoreductase, partial [Anaerolineales bacterium]|nr:LLM class F420-dependent oxidoreductase [Anaerolineales bacterium]
VPSFTWPGGTPEIGARLAEIGQAADEAGFYSLWVMDHFFQIRGVGELEEPMLESYSALGYLAGLTHNVQLGTLVTGVVYRRPGILVKTATTLDVLSGGRAYFGIGAAWFEREAKGLGVPFPPLKERFERLEESLQIAKQMWSGQVASYHGKHYQLAETLTSPQPVSRPHPPILIGGMGERKTLRLVAQYADACNLFARAGDDVLRHKLEVLRQHCEDVGRPYAEIERTVLSTVKIAPDGMSASEMVQMCRGLAQMGIQHLIVNMPNVHKIKPIEIIGREVIPTVAEL